MELLLQQRTPHFVFLVTQIAELVKDLQILVQVVQLVNI
jgi:hypothetical protein